MSVDPYEKESARDRAIRLIEDELVDPVMMVTACVKYMSEEDVEDMLDVNELSQRFDDKIETWYED
jgi:hypothetical protein